MSRPKEYDFLFKLLLVGDSGVGKSELLSRYSYNSYSGSLPVTTGVDFKIRTIDIGDKKIKLQMWDTAGVERFRSITTTYYKGAEGVIVCFDISDRNSFDRIKYHYNEVLQYGAEKVTILVGCKSDTENRCVSYEGASALAEKLGISYYEASAKTGNSVNEPFEKLAEVLVEKKLNPTPVGTPAANTKPKRPTNSPADEKNSKCEIC